MKIGTVAGTNDSTTTIATNDMVQEHVTNFTKELFGYIANGIGDDISSIARTMLGEVVEKIDNYTMGLNSWKIAPNERGDKKGVPGLSCFQPH